MTLPLETHCEPQDPSTPFSGVVIWHGPGPILLVQSEFFPGINIWTVGRRCYLLSQELLGWGWLWPCSVPCGHNLAEMEKNNAIPQAKSRLTESDGHSRRRKASAGSLRLWFLQPFLCFCGLHSLSPHESHFWITSLWDRFLLFVTKTGLTTIAPYNRTESDEADN